MKSLLFSLAALSIANAQLPPGCTEGCVDIVFVIDESGSVGSNNFATYIKPFMAGIRPFLPACRRVGLIDFGTTPRIEEHLDKYGPTWSDAEYDLEISQLAFGNLPGWTNTDEAIELAVEEFAFHPPPTGWKRLLVIITDGEPCIPNDCAHSVCDQFGSDSAYYSLGDIQSISNPPAVTVLVGVGNLGNNIASNSKVNCLANPANIIQAGAWDDIQNAVNFLDLIECPPPDTPPEDPTQCDPFLCEVELFNGVEFMTTIDAPAGISGVEIGIGGTCRIEIPGLLPPVDVPQCEFDYPLAGIGADQTITVTVTPNKDGPSLIHLRTLCGTTFNQLPQNCYLYVVQDAGGNTVDVSGLAGNCIFRNPTTGAVLASGPCGSTSYPASGRVAVEFFVEDGEDATINCS